jgi:hypothetical protein
VSSLTLSNHDAAGSYKRTSLFEQVSQPVAPGVEAVKRSPSLTKPFQMAALPDKPNEQV